MAAVIVTVATVAFAVSLIRRRATRHVERHTSTHPAAVSMTPYSCAYSNNAVIEKSEVASAVTTAAPLDDYAMGERPVSNPALPPGWSQWLDPSTRVFYYHNELTNESSWTPPAALLTASN